MTVSYKLTCHTSYVLISWKP